MPFTRLPSGRRYHRVLVEQPDGDPVPDGDGGWTQAYEAAQPWQVAIEPATAQRLERLTTGTVLAQASHVVTGPYRADITTRTQLTFNDRLLHVLGVANPDERNLETIAVCAELVT